MRLSTVVSALALVAIATFVSAHGDVPFTSPNVIHGCRNQNTGALRQISTGACANGEAIVHWNVTGPAGTNGTNGINGTNGTNGIDGINGTNGTNGINGVDASRPDPPCLDVTNRYVDCGNGTVTDTVTDLIWLKDASCLGLLEWIPANQAAASLKEGDCSLTDHSSPGDWRLPTADEWSATVARAVALGCGTPTAPSLTDDAGTTCYDAAGGTSFVGVFASTPVDPNMIYWSSNANELSPTKALVMFLNGGFSGGSVLKHLLHAGAWPVRSGHR